MTLNTTKKYDLAIYQKRASEPLTEDELKELASLLKEDKYHQLVIDSDLGNVAVGLVTDDLLDWWNNYDHLNRLGIYNLIRLLIDNRLEDREEDETDFCYENRHIYFDDSAYKKTNMMTGGTPNL